MIEMSKTSKRERRPIDFSRIFCTTLMVGPFLIMIWGALAGYAQSDRVDLVRENIKTSSEEWVWEEFSPDEPTRGYYANRERGIVVFRSLAGKKYSYTVEFSDGETSAYPFKQPQAKRIWKSANQTIPNGEPKPQRDIEERVFEGLKK